MKTRVIGAVLAAIILVEPISSCGSQAGPTSTTTTITGQKYALTGDFYPNGGWGGNGLPGGGSIVDAETGLTVKWQLFIPKNAVPGVMQPMIIYAGGLETIGSDNWININQELGLLVHNNASTITPYYLFPQEPASPSDIDKQKAWVNVIGTIVAQVEAMYSVDPKKVTLVGYSSGAMLMQVAAYKWPTTFAGLCMIEGTSQRMYSYTSGLLPADLPANVQAWYAGVGKFPMLFLKAGTTNDASNRQEIVMTEMTKLTGVPWKVTHSLAPGAYSPTDKWVMQYWDADSHNTIPHTSITLANTDLWNWLVGQSR